MNTRRGFLSSMLKAGVGALILPSALTYSRKWHFGKGYRIHELLGIYEEYRIVRDHQPGRTYIPMPQFKSGCFTGITKVGYLVHEPTYYRGFDVGIVDPLYQDLMIERIEFKNTGLEYGSIEKARIVCSHLNAATQA